jgi:hypothetical protein
VLLVSSHLPQSAEGLSDVDFLAKPYTPVALVEQVERLLSRG